MAKLIIHNGNETPESIANRRLLENLLLTPHERFKKTFQLMALAALFKNGPIKTPQGLGVVLKRKLS
ncbi:MAG: hypothetical protein ABIQ40_13770 [Bacteroidia bacterium]